MHKGPVVYTAGPFYLSYGKTQAELYSAQPSLPSTRPLKNIGAKRIEKAAKATIHKICDIATQY